MLSKKSNLKEYLLEMTLDKKDILQPEDIYNFYYMNFVLTDHNEKANLDEDQINSIRFEINEIKKKYLNAFLPVVRNQLKKYLSRGRTDAQAYKESDLKTAIYSNLDQMMRRTYRSDMKRRNINWENLTTNLADLQGTSEIKRIMFHIDRINNAIHNAQESMLVKFDNGAELQQALADSHRLNPKQLQQKTADLSFLKEEQEVGKAYVFDVDDTLIKSGSKIKVINNGQVVRKLTPQEFNVYKKEPGETFDFSEFDQIINPKKYKAWKVLENVNRKITQGKSNSTIYILTARGSGVVDALEKFLAANKITQINRENIFAIGDKGGVKTVAEKKRDVLEQIKAKHSGQVTFFDDAVDNIELAREIGVNAKQIKESILDEPQKEMDQKIWEGVPPRLKQEVFVQIANGLLFLGEDAPITKLIVAGSLTGLRWTEDSDLDVTVILDVSEEELEELKSKLPEVNGEFAAGTKHPINYFLMNKDPGLDRFDSAYEPLSKEWLKPPKTEGISVADVYDKFKSLFKKIDVEKEEAKRSIVDIKLLEKALENSADPRMVAEKIVQRIQDLDKSVGDLAQTFKKVHKDRDKAFADYEKAGGGPESPNLQPENIKYKMLERYHYLDFLKQLYKLMKKDGVETPEGFEKVADLLSKNEEIVTTKFNEDERIQIERKLSEEKRKILIDFIKFVEKEEKIESPIKIILQDGRGELRTTGVYNNKEKTLRVNIKNRALVDVLRTIAHELVHHRQNESGKLTKHPHQDIGGPIEDEANSKAGIYIKKFAKDTGTDIYADEVNILEEVEMIIEQTLERLNAAE